MKKLSAGIDVGSTTVKMVVLNEKSRPSLPSMNATIRISKLPQKSFTGSSGSHR